MRKHKPFKTSWIPDPDSHGYYESHQYVLRWVDRKTKKAIKKIWKHDYKRLTKRMEYVMWCFDNEYDHHYIAGGYDCFEPTIDSPKMRNILDCYREKKPFREIVYG